MPHRQYIHRPTVIKDLTVLAVVNLIFFFAFMNFDALESLYFFSRDYEQFELDELIPLGITVAFSFLVFSYRRIKELGLMAQTLEQMSLLDPLTGLPNRRAGQISLITWCELANEKNEDFAIYQIDLDNFKHINAMYGQMVGDDVLKLVAQKVANNLPEGALFCRWLDDNFIVVTRITPTQTPAEFALALQQLISNKIMTATVDLTCCIGFSLYQKGNIVEDILHDVEDALAVAKHKGKNSIHGHMI